MVTFPDGVMVQLVYAWQEAVNVRALLELITSG
jgi:hypothetical protein